MYLWEILHLTIKKMNKHVIKLGSELGEAKEQIQRADSGSSSDSEDEGGVQKRKKIEATDKPTEEVSDLLCAVAYFI